MRTTSLVLSTCGLSLVAATCAAAPEATTGAPAAAGMVKQIKIVTDKAPDCSSLKSTVDTVTRGCKTNDEKAIAIYNAGRLLWYHRAYPGEEGGIAALKMINVYGWSLCGGQHTVLAALWRAAGWDWRYIGWKGHTTVECRYDDQWHYFDTFLKVYTWKPDPNAPGGRTVASQADIRENPGLITENFVYDQPRRVWYPHDNRFEIINDKANWVAPAFFVCGDTPEGVVEGVKDTRAGETSVKFGHMGLKMDEDGYSTDVNLGPGYSLELMWKHIDDAHWYHWRTGRKYVPGHTCGDKDYRNCPAIGPILEPYRYLDERGARTFSSGYLRYAPDLASDAFLSALAGKQNVQWSKGQIAPADGSKPASITVQLQSPYIMSRASGAAPGIEKAEVSLDDGKTWQEIELSNFDDAVGGKYACQVRLTFTRPVRSLDIEAIVQHNRCALPYLSPGPNQVTVSAADPRELGENRLAVTYAYSVGSRSVPYEHLADMGAELGRCHKASWSDTPTVVRRVFLAEDLPATFDIPVPTAKGKYPVYPRMLFLRREVLAPGQKPIPLPKGAVEPKLGRGAELKTLPNPFLMGIARPPKKVERPIVTRRMPLECSHVIWRTAEGELSDDTFDNYPIKTRPKSPEAWVMLIGGDLSGLPGARDFKAARLCIPVTSSNPNAPTQVGASLLTKRFRRMKPYDFRDLGSVVGTTVVPKQAEPGPAKYHKIDVTRALKSVAAGEAAFHGFAVQVIPNRSVDDGWTVRIDITKDEPTYLELDVYSRK
ncbi:MAG: hypothetical protein ACE5JM_00740 [Armatimonadota bacterium]